MSLQELKSKRKSSIDSLVKKMGQINGNAPQSSDDEKMWKPAVDKAGNGQAIIRFLPEPKGEEDPVVRLWNHGFQGPGGWYIENSLTTLNRDDPVSEHNSKLWNSGREQDKDIARKQKRRLKFYSNIMVIKDPANPQNEGKVFLYEYGKKIFDMINDQMNPRFDDEDPVNPFDFWEGANFRIKIRKVDGYWNYDKSAFDSPTPLSEDDDELEAIWNKQHSLQEIISEDKFKSYDVLKERLNKVLGLSEAVSAPAPKPVEEKSSSEYLDDDIPFDVETKVSDDDDDLSVFKSLMDDD